VLSHRGVVGRVVGEPAPRAARVQLLIDRNAGAGALIERSRAGGVVIGDDAKGLRMQYVSNLSDVEVGDVVVTSGLDGIYPKGFVIGEVIALERGQGLYQEILVRPSVDFSSLEELLIVLDGPAGAADEGAE
jgi:rod shape-determining protein MreC